MSISFLHAFLGCDTTSSIFGIGRECANVFNEEPSTTKDQVCAAGEKALVAIYNGEENTSLDDLRYNVFCAKLVSAKFQNKTEALPPISAAAKYQSM